LLRSRPNARHRPYSPIWRTTAQAYANASLHQSVESHTTRFSALEAIRQQVDDYFVKPTEIEQMVSRIRKRLSARSSTGLAQWIIPERLPEVLDQCLDSITADWLSEVNKDPELAATRLSETERKDHVPDLLRESVNRARAIGPTAENIRAAAQHGQRAASKDIRSHFYVCGNGSPKRRRN
jgi:hypothetical protein